MSNIQNENEARKARFAEYDAREKELIETRLLLIRSPIRRKIIRFLSIMTVGDICNIILRKLRLKRRC